MTNEDHGGPAVHVFNVLRGEASQIRSTPFGDVGTVFSGQGIELAWVSKLGEPVDDGWFCSEEIDLILVVQGQLKFEFESPGQPDRVLGVGEVLVLPAGARCRDAGTMQPAKATRRYSGEPECSIRRARSVNMSPVRRRT